MKFFSKVRGLKQLWKALGENKPDIYGVYPWQEKSGLSPGASISEQTRFYNSWSAAAADVIANDIAKTKFRLFRDIPGEGEREEITDHPVVDLLSGFNQFETPYETWELISLFLDYAGNWFGYMAKDSLGVPREIWGLPPERVKILPDRKKFIRGYLFRSGPGKEIFLEPDEVIHIKLGNLKNRYWGQSTIMKAAYAVDANEYMSRYSQGVYKNSGRPGMVLETEDELSQEEFNRLTAQFESEYKGPENVGKMMLLEGGLKAKPFTLTPQELDWLVSQKFNRDEICALFGVPLAKVGIVEDVNRANAEALDYTFKENTIDPRLTRLTSKLNLSLVRPIWPDLYLDYDPVIPKDKEFELKKVEMEFKQGAITINDYLRNKGKDPVSWGSVPIMPMNMAPIDEDSLEDEKALQLDWMMKALTVEEILFDEATANEALGSTLSKQILNALEQGYKNAIELLGIDGPIEWTPKSDPRVEAILKKNLEHVKDITATTQQSLVETLTIGIAEGEDVAALKKRITKVYDFAEDARTNSIARTTATQGINQGQYLAMNDNEVEGKRWLTQRDGNARAEHEEADWQFSKLNEPFDVGGEALSFPGDGAGSAENVLNCRRTVSPDKEESKEASEKKKIRIWKMIEAVRMPQEKSARRQIKRYFRAQRREVLSNLNEASKSMRSQWLN